ncbi:BA14K family protein, partial [Mesorhizobium sp. M7A.T.Ca.TU.009.01.1.2]
FVLGSLLAQPRTVYVDEGGGSWHVRRCYDRYASYDADSDTYLGRDGYRHYCRL